jgi:hypothetical protein
MLVQMISLKIIYMSRAASFRRRRQVNLAEPFLKSILSFKSTKLLIIALNCRLDSLSELRLVDPTDFNAKASYWLCSRNRLQGLSMRGFIVPSI